ncbi:MAG: GIY-YIG nuclease family protein [Candidatus Gracilibacteria bacterium]|jgi:putative endonuclease
MYYVYVLRSKKDGKCYIGQSSDLEQRLSYHNKGRVKSTRKRLPFMLIYKELFKTRAEAMKREKYLKSLKNGNEFKKIIG